MIKSEEPHPGLHFAVAGATATGKSEVALLLAEKMGGEIISVDSMQVYRGLDIGTAKPSRPNAPACRITSLISAEIDGKFDAAQFARLARAAVKDIQARGKVPILCGGTGLYFKAYLKAWVKRPPPIAKLRAELEAAPFEELLRELRERNRRHTKKLTKKIHVASSAPWK